MNRAWKEFSKGLWAELPPFRVLLGLCPTLAVTSKAENGLGMGMAVIFVLTLSNLIISTLRKLIPAKVRIACFIVITASLVVAVELLMQAYAYPLYQQLGIFVPLIVVNCLILGRAEAFASKNGVFHSILDALGMGLGFTLSLTFLGGVRELLGTGCLFGAQIMWDGFKPFAFMVQAPGAFVCLGLILAGMNRFNVWQARRHNQKPPKALNMADTCAQCGMSGLCNMDDGKISNIPGTSGRQRERTMDYLLLVVSAIFINNIVLVQYLGTCPFMGTSKSTDVALGMGGAVVFVMLMATGITWPIQRFILDPSGIGYLQTIVFILVIASLVQFVEMFLRKLLPPLYNSLGLFLPLITTNCAVLGMAIMCQRSEYGFFTSLIVTGASGVGFTLALLIISSIRERLETAPIPAAFKGVPIALVLAGIMSLAFLAFQGMAA